MRHWLRHLWIAAIASLAGHLLLYAGFFLFVSVFGDGVAGGNRLEKGLNVAGTWFRFTAHTTAPITVLLLFVFVTLLAQTSRPQVLTAVFAVLLAGLTPFLHVSAPLAYSCIAGRACGVDLQHVGLITAFGFLITLPSAILACVVALKMAGTGARRPAPG